MNILLVTLGLAVGGVVAGCQSIPAPVVENDRLFEFGEIPATVAVELKRDESVRLSLRENATTGYSWEVVGTVPGFEVRIEHVGAPEPKAGEPMLCGAPGQAAVVVVRTGASASEGTVTLNYRRPWEKGVPPVESVTLMIRPLP